MTLGPRAGVPRAGLVRNAPDRVHTTRVKVRRDRKLTHVGIHCLARAARTRSRTCGATSSTCSPERRRRNGTANRRRRVTRSATPSCASSGTSRATSRRPRSPPSCTSRSTWRSRNERSPGPPHPTAPQADTGHQTTCSRSSRHSDCARSGSVLGFRRKPRPNGVDPSHASLSRLDQVLLRELEALRYALAGLLQWALHGINVLVTRPAADRASRVRGGIDLFLIPRQAWLGTPSVVCHGLLLASG